MFKTIRFEGRELCFNYGDVIISVWGLYFEGGPLDYDTTQTITIKAKCEDDDTAGPEKTFLIRVKKNEAPTFTNIDIEGTVNNSFFIIHD